MSLTRAICLRLATKRSAGPCGRDSASDSRDGFGTRREKRAPKTMTSLLTATHVDYTYERGARRIVNDVSLSIARGSIVGLLGPNGAGKTTLLRLLAGTLTPARGEIALDGRPLASRSRRELARHIAVVPQETHSAFDFSALDIVLMGRYPHLGAFELEGAN